jgi:SNF2 family DNA or RNA helicase
MIQLKLSSALSEPWHPHAYQRRAVKFLLEHAASALFLDPGLGKTAITLAAFKVLKKKGLAKKALVIASLRICYDVWPKQIDQWTDFAGITYQVLHGPGKDAALATPADVYIINPEGLGWLLQVKKEKVTSVRTGRTATKISADSRRWKSLEFDTLIVDELSAFKHTGSDRFKTLKLVLQSFARRWGLTGSPASNGLLDLFGQCYVLDLGNALGSYVTHYRTRYFTPSYDGFGWTIREGEEEEIYKRLSPLVLRMAAEDYLEMPELIENRIYVDLPPDVMNIYEAVEDDLFAKIGDRLVVASTAAAASTKCRQVANGGVYLDPEVLALVKLPKSNREWVNLHTEKVDALAGLIDELQGSPLLVAYDFEHDLDRLRIKFGKDIPYIGGGVTPKRSSELVSLWNAGKLPVLYGHPQSVAHGLNLQEAGHHVCWHSLTWNFELYDQFIRRVLRQGNKSKRVFVHHIMARGTIDDAMLAVLKSKGKGQGTLFDALKRLATNKNVRGQK